MSLWLDAADASTITESSGAVSKWTDKSVNAYEFDQATAGKKPTTNSTTVNGLNSLDLDGGDVLVSNTNVAIRTASTHFLVWNPPVYSTQPVVLEQSTDTNLYAGYFFSPTTAVQHGLQVAATDGGLTDRVGVDWADGYDDNAVNLMTFDNSAGTYAGLNLRHNGTDLGAPDSNAGANYDGDTGDIEVDDAIYMGGRGTSPSFGYEGELCEYIVYDGALSVSDRDAVEAYLAAKWGITI